jgi:hypothetical protein
MGIQLAIVLWRFIGLYETHVAGANYTPQFDIQRLSPGLGNATTSVCLRNCRHALGQPRRGRETRKRAGPDNTNWRSPESPSVVYSRASRLNICRCVHRAEPRFARSFPGSSSLMSSGSLRTREYNIALMVACGVLPTGVINPIFIARSVISPAVRGVGRTSRPGAQRRSRSSVVCILTLSCPSLPAR